MVTTNGRVRVFMRVPMFVSMRMCVFVSMRMRVRFIAVPVLVPVPLVAMAVPPGCCGAGE